MPEQAPFPASYLFAGQRGGRVKRSIRRELPEAVKKAGLRYGIESANGITFHTFRHSMARLTLNSGIPEPVVQAMGNWKTSVMVKRYAHLADKTFRQAAAKLDGIVDGQARQGRDNAPKESNKQATEHDHGDS